MKEGLCEDIMDGGEGLWVPDDVFIDEDWKDMVEDARAVVINIGSVKFLIDFVWQFSFLWNK